MTESDHRNLAKLSKYLPDGTAPDLFSYLKTHSVALKIKKPRKSKLGDYRHPHGSLGHRISINGNLNPYSFLVTLVHEMAHLETWNQKGNKTEPHGRVWKNNFQRMLLPYVSSHILPDSIVEALNKYLENPKASSCADLNLSRTLSSFDAFQQVTLEQLDEGSVFSLSNGKMYKKGPQLRKRYKCLCLTDERWYYVNPLVGVETVNQEVH